MAPTTTNFAGKQPTVAPSSAESKTTTPPGITTSIIRRLDSPTGKTSNCDAELKSLIDQVNTIGSNYLLQSKKPNAALMNKMLKDFKDFEGESISKNWKDGILLLDNYCDEFKKVNSITILPKLEKLIQEEIEKREVERFKNSTYKLVYRKDYINYLKHNGFIPHDFILFSNKLSETVKAFRSLYGDQKRVQEIDQHMKDIQALHKIFNEKSSEGNNIYIIPLTGILLIDNYRQKLISDKSTHLLLFVTRCLDHYFGIMRNDDERHWKLQKSGIENKTEPLTNAIIQMKEKAEEVWLADAANVATTNEVPATSTASPGYPTRQL